MFCFLIITSYLPTTHVQIIANEHLERMEENSRDAHINASSGKSPGRKKSQKFPYIEDILVSMAKSGQLHKGTKLSLAECHLVNKKDNSQFVNTMKLVEELYGRKKKNCSYVRHVRRLRSRWRKPRLLPRLFR